MDILQVAADFSNAYKVMNWAFHRMSQEDLRARVEFRSVISKFMPLVTNRKMREDDVFLLYEDLEDYAYGTLHVLHPGNLYMEPVTVTKEDVENGQGDYKTDVRDGNMYILSAGLPLIKLLVKKGSRFIPYEEVDKIFPSMFGWARDVSYHLKKFTDMAEKVTNDFLGQVRRNPNLFIQFRIEVPLGVHKNDPLLHEFKFHLNLLNKKNMNLRKLNEKLYKSNMKIVSTQDIIQIRYQQAFDAMWCFLFDKQINGYVVCLLTSKDENNNNILPISSENELQVWKQIRDRNPERVDFLKMPYGYARIRHPDYDVSNALKSYIYKIDIENLHVLSRLVGEDGDDLLIPNMEKIQRLFADLRPFTDVDFVQKLTEIEDDSPHRATYLPPNNVVYNICSMFKGLYDLFSNQDMPFDLREFELRIKNYADEDSPGGYAVYTRKCIDFVTPTNKKIAELKQSRQAFIMVRNGAGELGEYSMYCTETSAVLPEADFFQIKAFYEQIKKIHLQETGFGFVKARGRNMFRTLKSRVFGESYPDPVIYMINQSRSGVAAPSPTANNNLLLVAMLLQVQAWEDEFGEFV